jgi:hypothetical protein
MLWQGLRPQEYTTKLRRKTLDGRLFARSKARVTLGFLFEKARHPRVSAASKAIGLANDNQSWSSSSKPDPR